MQWVIDIIYGRVLDFFKYFADLHDYQPAAGEMIIGDGDVWTHQPWIDWRDTAQWLSTTGHGNFDLGLSLGANLTMGNNDITGIDTIYADDLRLNADFGNYFLFDNRGTNQTIQTQASTQPHIIEHYTKDGDMSDNLAEIWYSRGTPSQQADLEHFRVLFAGTPDNEVFLFTHSKGSGVDRPVSIGASSRSQHHAYQPDGDSEMKEGPIDYAWAMGTSTKDPTSDAPADWIEVKINGTVRYLPAYAA